MDLFVKEQVLRCGTPDAASSSSQRSRLACLPNGARPVLWMLSWDDRPPDARFILPVVPASRDTAYANAYAVRWWSALCITGGVAEHDAF